MNSGANPDVPVIMDIPADVAQRAKSRLQAAWDFPYTYSQFSPAVVLYPRDGVMPECSIEERIHNAEADFRCQMAWAEWDLACLREAGACNIPSLSPYMGVGVIPSGFGCEIRCIPGEDPWTIPLAIDLSDAAGLRSPCFEGPDAGLAGLVLDRIDYYSKRTGDSVPVRLTDTQSPMDIAVQIIKDEHILLGMYENPDAVHVLLRTVAAALIQFVRLQAERAANFFGHTHQGIWRHRGIYVSDDMAAVVSPAFYHEFFVPYNQIVAAQFGGISIHCCRRYQQNLDEIAHMDGFMSFDADASYNDPEVIAHALATDTTHSRFRGIWHAWAENADEAVEKALFAAARGFGLILTVKCGSVTEGAQAVAAVERATAIDGSASSAGLGS
ncbi:MAG: uroporphyrinogen decarboxylase family protein [Clostridia bacterium]|nr:uroporphyrinogen decarboxylase family protein [Clostridia bacterium]